MSEVIPYASEIIKIVEAGLEKDHQKVRAYAELMVQKMKIDDKDATLLGALESRLDGSYKDKPKLKLMKNEKKRT